MKKRWLTLNWDRSGSLFTKPPNKVTPNRTNPYIIRKAGTINSMTRRPIREKEERIKLKPIDGNSLSKFLIIKQALNNNNILLKNKLQKRESGKQIPA